MEKQRLSKKEYLDQLDPDKLNLEKKDLLNFCDGCIVEWKKNKIHVRSTLKTTLKNHKIPTPGYMGITLADEVNLDIKFFVDMRPLKEQKKSKSQQGTSLSFARHSFSSGVAIVFGVCPVGI